MVTRGRGFAQLHTIEEARNIFDKYFKIPLKVETIEVVNSINRKLSKAIYSPNNLPGFRRAAMDGFALVANNTFGATENNPIELKIIGIVEIGDTKVQNIENGQAVRISTGAPVPVGATGVIKIEDCEIRDKTVEIYSAITEGKNISKEDEDVKKGELIFESGTILKPWDLTLLLSLSIKEIEVNCRPKVSLLSTGSEVLPINSFPETGQVIDSTRPAILAWLEMIGCEIIETNHSIDDPKIIATALSEMARKSDLVLTTGGTSVGTKDYLPEVIENLGELLVHGIAIRPGKPLALGVLNGHDKITPIISLPGYPVAAFINFHLFVSYYLTQITGQSELIGRKTKVKLSEKIASRVGTRDFVRLTMTEKGAKLLRISGAGILTSLTNADYLLEVPYDLEGYNAGDIVEVFQLR